MIYHSFSVDVATILGLEEAIILNNLYYWIDKNKANNRHYYDGSYWTYSSSKALHLLFPYISEHSIYRLLRKLEEKNVIIRGNYNIKGYDRTMWYAITEYGFTILQNCKMHLAKMQNGFCENAKPIPDIIINNTNTKVLVSKFDFKKQLIQDGYCEALASEYMEVRKKHKAVNTETAYKRLNTEIQKINKKFNVSKNEVLELIVSKSWQSINSKWDLSIYFEEEEKKVKISNRL